MVRKALHPVAATARQLFRLARAAADRVLAAMEERRSTWQIWHACRAQRHLDPPTYRWHRPIGWSTCSSTKH
jgi:hypothetical protein